MKPVVIDKGLGRSSTHGSFWTSVVRISQQLRPFLGRWTGGRFYFPKHFQGLTSGKPLLGPSPLLGSRTSKEVRSKGGLLVPGFWAPYSSTWKPGSLCYNQQFYNFQWMVRRIIVPRSSRWVTRFTERSLGQHLIPGSNLDHEGTQKRFLRSFQTFVGATKKGSLG